MYAFPLTFNNNIWGYSAPLQDIRLQNLSLILTFQNHSRSNVMVSFNAPYMVSY